MSLAHLLDNYRKPWLKARVEDIIIDGNLIFTSAPVINNSNAEQQQQ